MCTFLQIQFYLWYISVYFILEIKYFQPLIFCPATVLLQSKFEFHLRLQEFIELVRADKTVLAIEYARKYLAMWGATYMKELQHAMATLAFKSNTECESYKVELFTTICFIYELVMRTP